MFNSRLRFEHQGTEKCVLDETLLSGFKIFDKDIKCKGVQAGLLSVHPQPVPFVIVEIFV